MMATELLRKQHRRIESLVDGVTSDVTAQRVAQVLQLVEELFTHLSIEEGLFLGPIADATGISVGAYRESQSIVRNAVLQAVFVEGDPADFDARRRELAQAFAQHSRALERDLLPAVEENVARTKLERMGARMQAFWDAAMGGSAPARRSHVDAAE